MTIYWKAVEQCFTLGLFVFQFYPVCNFEKFISFGLGAVKSERVNALTRLSRRAAVENPSSFNCDFGDITDRPINVQHSLKFC